MSLWYNLVMMYDGDALIFILIVAIAISLIRKYVGKEKYEDWYWKSKYTYKDSYELEHGKCRPCYHFAGYQRSKSPWMVDNTSNNGISLVVVGFFN